ncbi:MAG: SxtJ family membrane protein [Verrucomicrobiota bacterium]
MIEVDWHPDEKKLRSFGYFALPAFALAGLLIGLKFGSFREGDFTLPLIFWSLGCIASLLAVFRPQFLKPLYWLLSAISLVVGPVIGLTILALIFLLLFTPIGLLLRLTGRDPLRLKTSAKVGTYWQAAEKTSPAKRYFDQF